MPNSSGVEQIRWDPTVGKCLLPRAQSLQESKTLKGHGFKWDQMYYPHVYLCVCWDKTPAAKGQVTTCEKKSSKQRKTLVKPAACVLQCERRICHLTSHRTEIFITEVTANPYVCAANVSISLNWASPASFCLRLWMEVVSGGGEMRGEEF